MPTYNRGPAEFDSEGSQRNVLFEENITVVRGATAVINDVVAITGVMNEYYFPNVEMSDTFNTCSIVQNLFEANPHIIDNIELQGAISFVWNDIIQDTFNILDAPVFDPNIFVRVSDKLVASGIVSTNTEAYLLISDSIKLLDSAIFAWGAKIVDSLNIPDGVIDNLVFFNAIVESLNIIDTASFEFNIFIAVRDNIDISDSQTLQQILHERLSDGFSFTGQVELNGDLFTFVLNTENEAISSYNNYNFNSISGNLGADSTGIYELNGESDVGNNIQASIKTSLMDFGSSLHKQIPYAYIGFTSDGTLVLKVISDQHGNKNERWYECKTSYSADDTTRIRLGKGVKARYWQFQLENMDGTDFDIESIELMPLTLNRRI